MQPNSDGMAHRIKFWQLKSVYHKTTWLLLSLLVIMYNYIRILLRPKDLDFVGCAINIY